MTKSTTPNIVFWTEGGQGIGMGHLCRSLVIAKEFQKLGHASLFVINDDDAARSRVSAGGFSFKLSNFDAEELPPSLDKTPKIVIFDTKKDVTALIKALKPSGYKVALLDNTTSARLAADIVIYPSALFDDNFDRTGLSGRVCGGTGFVPVDEIYMEAAAKCRKLKHQPPYCILVTMGGSDPKQLTYRVVSSLLSLSHPIDIRVVTGPAFTSDPRLDELERGNDPRLRFFRNQDNLAPLMADSHVAVTAVGTTLNELAMVGVPAIIIANYAEDRRDMERYQTLGMNLPLGFYRDITSLQIQEAVRRFIEDTAVWRSMRNKGWQTIDGHGARRIVECLLANI
jgi:UDP-2,4-diacetamido-2,4,6-trideoxy-beta-L-altropyranose hydrolase